MCQSQAQGGRRCAAHTRAAVAKHPVGTYPYINALAEHAQTPTGAREVHQMWMQSTDLETVRSAYSALVRSGLLKDFPFVDQANLSGPQYKMAEAIAAAAMRDEDIRCDDSTNAEREASAKLLREATRALDDTIPAVKGYRDALDRAPRDISEEEYERLQDDLVFARLQHGVVIIDENTHAFHPQDVDDCRTQIAQHAERRGIDLEAYAEFPPSPEILGPHNDWGMSVTAEEIINEAYAEHERELEEWANAVIDGEATYY